MKKFVFTFFQDPKLYQYIVVGGLSAIVDLGLFILLRHELEYHYLILATMSFVAATFVNFLLCNFFVFKHPQRRAATSRFALTYMVSGIGLSIHHSCLYFAVESLGLPMVLSKIGAMGVAFGWNFLSRKHLVFAHA